jgi:REP element-mobilizing transposase RayT
MDRGEWPFAPTEFKSPSNTIGAIIRGYKGATTKKIKKLFDTGNIDTGNIDTGVLQYAPIPIPIPISPTGSIWQRNYYEHIIRNENEYNRITQYIINNPKNWKKDKFKNT